MCAQKTYTLCTHNKFAQTQLLGLEEAEKRKEFFSKRTKTSPSLSKLSRVRYLLVSFLE
jgi:hypothetical protein